MSLFSLAFSGRVGLPGEHVREWWGGGGDQVGTYDGLHARRDGCRQGAIVKVMATAQIVHLRAPDDRL